MNTQVKKNVGQSMMKLLNEKELHAVSGGPKGPVPPSGPSPCTYIPGRGNSGTCR